MTDDQSPFSLDSLQNANGTSDAYFILQMYFGICVCTANIELKEQYFILKEEAPGCRQLQL
jgi:hypothetical protein